MRSKGFCPPYFVELIKRDEAHGDESISELMSRLSMGFCHSLVSYILAW